MHSPQPERWQQVNEIIQRWATHGRSGLLPCLLEVQDITGYLSPELCAHIARHLRVPEADVYGLISFYSLLYDRPVGRVVLRVCDDVPCYVRGSSELLNALQEALGLEPNKTTADGAITLEVHPCLGRCERAPFVLINDDEIGPARAEDVLARVQAHLQSAPSTLSERAEDPAATEEGTG